MGTYFRYLAATLKTVLTGPLPIESARWRQGRSLRAGIRSVSPSPEQPLP